VAHKIVFVLALTVSHPLPLNIFLFILHNASTSFSIFSPFKFHIFFRFFRSISSPCSIRLPLFCVLHLFLLSLPYRSHYDILLSGTVVTFYNKAASSFAKASCFIYLSHNISDYGYVFLKSWLLAVVDNDAVFSGP
jgi:hypothetical protein